MNTTVNRQIVQEGLARRAALRRDAALEDQARKLRIIINDNHDAKAGARGPVTFQTASNSKASTQSRRRRNTHREDQEAQYCYGWYRFMFRVFAPFLVAVVVMALCNADIIPCWLAVPFAIVPCAVAIEAFGSRLLSRKRKSAK